MDKVSVILPSMNRPSLLKQAVKQLFLTTYGKHDIELILIIDGDETAVREIFYLMPQLDNDFAGNSGFKNWFVNLSYSPTSRGALNSWNIGLKKSTGNIIFPSGDDGFPHGNWLDYALESHRDKLQSYGMVGFNDLMHNANLTIATTVLFDRKFCQDHLGGVVTYPVYNYYCVDMELNARARNVGKFYWDERAIVEHLHSANGKRPLDDNDRIRMENNWMEIDNKIFQERKLQGFPNNFEAVI